MSHRIDLAFLTFATTMTLACLVLLATNIWIHGSPAVTATFTVSGLVFGIWTYVWSCAVRHR